MPEPRPPRKVDAAYAVPAEAMEAGDEEGRLWFWRNQEAFLQRFLMNEALGQPVALRRPAARASRGWSRKG